MPKHRRLFEIALLSCAAAPMACGDDGSPQQAESSTTEPAVTTSTGLEPDSGSTAAAASSSTAADPTEGESTGTGGASTSETTAAETTAADSNTDASTGGDDGVLGNTPVPCVEDDYVFPLLPAEAGHWAATTLTPPAYPYEVQRVAYELAGGAAGGQCNNSFAHQVAIFVSDGPQPDDAPSTNAAGYVAYPIDEDPVATEARLVELELDAPIVLEDGQSVVVAVQLTAVGDSSLCIAACFDTGGVPELDWWSNAVDEPFSWADMVADFGFPSNFTIQAFGAAR
jgi:hypothetical protein